MATGETLSFKANRTNSGKYWCLADNGFDTIVNASTYLNVQCKSENIISAVQCKSEDISSAARECLI